MQMRLFAAKAKEPRALLRCLRVAAGCNRRPRESSAGSNTNPATGPTLSDRFPTNPPRRARQQYDAFRRGVEQFNTGRFFDAHETWEEVWLRSPEPEKTFLQGIIQIAAAFHHFSRGNARGTQNLLRAGLARLARFPDAHRGIELATLRAQVGTWAAALAAGQTPAAEPPLPQIKFTGNG
jgi:uncharacterized protein